MCINRIKAIISPIVISLPESIPFPPYQTTRPIDTADKTSTTGKRQHNRILILNVHLYDQH